MLALLFEASRQENESADAPAPAPGEEAHSAEVDDNATDIFCPLLKEQHEPDVGKSEIFPLLLLKTLSVSFRITSILFRLL